MVRSPWRDGVPDDIFGNATKHELRHNGHTFKLSKAMRYTRIDHMEDLAERHPLVQVASRHKERAT